MAILGLPVLIALTGLGIGIARFALALYDSARVRAVERWLAESRAKWELARIEYERRQKEIDAQPDKHGDDLTSGLNDEWNKKP